MIINPFTGEVVNADCGTGAGGFKEGNTCAEESGDAVPFKQSNLLRKFPQLFDESGAVSSVSDKEFEEAQVKDVPLKHVRRFNQDDVDPQQVKELAAAYERGDEVPPISLLYYKGIYHIADGHHRASAVKQLGGSKIKAHVLRVLDDGTVTN